MFLMFLCTVGLTLCLQSKPPTFNGWIQALTWVGLNISYALCAPNSMIIGQVPWPAAGQTQPGNFPQSSEECEWLGVPPVP